MKSARIVSPRKIEIIDEPVPALEEGRVLIRLKKTALCGSDIPYYSYTFAPSSYPLPPGYPGHECMGIVEESKSSVFTPGELVMYYPPGLDAYKEYHCADPARLQKLPKGMDLNILVMTQLLGCVAHGAFRVDKPYNKHVVVMGQGPVGLLFTALMKNLGAKNIIAVDPLPWRGVTALQMGADHAVNPLESDVVGEVKNLTGGHMADIVIDAYGQEVAVINQCFDLACHNGQVAFFGICLEESPALNFNVFFRKELRMVASVGPDLTMDYPYGLDMILRGAVDVSPLITHTMPFDDIAKAFEIATNREEKVIKIILDM
ncbi:MAG TPA: zinc-binding dehydrogenase [Spirochaetota bacterium]|nr:zinc-binding dehydrogenase [Spirochaetota bacterium]HQO02299.1 zinc-binding dehydrogenase [Spirochaetota bacterium]HQP48666.1 zinc-binding dehydrogenase [Spirochaetota bacterium]